MSSLPTNDALAHLKEHLAKRYRAPAGAKVAYGIYLTDPPVLITCRWEFCDERPDDLAEDNQAEYGPFVFGQRWLGFDAALRHLDRVIRDGQFLEWKTASEYTTTWVDELAAPRKPLYSGWSELRVRFNAANRTRDDEIPRTPLVRMGHRPFASWTEAAAEWVWPEAGRGKHGCQHYCELVCILPDTRARLKSADWTPAGLSVEVEANVDTGLFEIQPVAFTFERGHSLATKQELSATWEVPDDAIELAVYLVLGAERLGTAELHARWDHYSLRSNPLDAADQAARDLKRGETDEIEFKEFIHQADQKESEIVRTIVAFANSGGGRLYLGVRDDGTVQRTADLFAAAKPKEQGSIPEKILADRVRTLAREKVKPVPVVDVEAVSVHDERIIVATVQAGTAGPYSTEANEVLIRSGATCRRPDPQTELPALYQALRGHSANIFEDDAVP